MEFAVYTISVKGIFSKHYEIHQDDRLMYRVRRPSFWAFKEMYFTEPGGKEVLKIKRHASLLTINSKFVMTKNGEAVATFEKDGFDNFYTSSSIYGEHTVQGNFFNSEYTIYNNDGEVAKISRKRFRSDKKYGIAIIKGTNELYILGMVIAISIVNSRRKRKA